MQSRAPEILDALFAKMRANHSYGTAWYVADDLTDIDRPYGVIEFLDLTDDSRQGQDGADHLFDLHYYEDTERAALAAGQETPGFLKGSGTLTLASGTNYCTSHDGEAKAQEYQGTLAYTHLIQTWRIHSDG